MMFPVETLPQSIVDTKTIVLKPRLDQGDIQLIGEKIKSRLFSKFGFKPNPRDVRLLGFEYYFEPYFIIGGKYSLDYCRKHVFRVNVKESTTKVFVAGQEFRSEQTETKATNRAIKMTGEEHVHYERQSYFVLDRMKREIPPDRLPLSPIDVQKEKIGLSSSFKTMHISEEAQIEFLKTKIAKRPDDVAEIIREVFDITERTVTYYPMYQLTFENTKNRKDATVTVNGITGEIILNGTKTLAVKTIVTFPETTGTQRVLTGDRKEVQASTPLEISSLYSKDELRHAKEENEQYQSRQPAQAATCEEKQVEKTMNNGSSNTTSSATNIPGEDARVQQTQPGLSETMTLGFPAKIFGEIFTVGENITVVVGDIEVSSGANIRKTLVVKGSLKLGDNCRAHGKLKALKDVTIGADTTIYGDLISGGNILIGPRAKITGSLQAVGYIRIGEQAMVERGLRSNPKTAIATDLQIIADFRNVVTSVAREK